MTPRTMIRTAALNALAAASSLDPADPDFAPLIGATASLGNSWPTPSPAPGGAPLANQLLIYGWDEDSNTIAEATTATQFSTAVVVIVEARLEIGAIEARAAKAALPATPSQSAIANAVDGALDALAFAVKKAICQGVQVAAMALNGNAPMIETVKSVKTQNKYDASGQRVAGNAVIGFDLIFTETFEPLLANAFDELVILTSAEAGGIANEGNTGNGTISAVTVGLGAEPGAYALSFTSATVFTVTMPDSSSAGSGTVGTPFSGGGLTFTISAGTHAFVAGDGFAVTVQVANETILNLSS